MFNSLSIGQRIGTGFMLMLVLLCLVVGIASVGIDYVVESAERLLEGNKLRSELMEHEIDHLAWEDALYTFLTDSRVQDLNIPLNDHKCKFGIWLFGPRRQQIETAIPELIPLFKSLEEPHHRLHQAAQKIKDTFHRADHNLPSFLLEQTSVHLQWLALLGDAIDKHQASSVNWFDIHKCQLDQWLKNKLNQQESLSGESRQFWEQMYLTHVSLHAKVEQILNRITYDQAVTQKTSKIPVEKLFFTQVLPTLRELLEFLKVLKNKALIDIQIETQSDEVLRNENSPNHNVMQQTLHEIRTVIDKKMVTDEKMLLLAQHTRNLITVISVLALLLAAFMAMRTGRDIITPLNHLTNLLTISTHTIKKPIADSEIESKTPQLVLPILVTRWAKYAGIFKIFYLWISRSYKSEESVKHSLSDIKIAKNNTTTQHIERSGIMHLLTDTNIPAEIALLAQAVNRYTEYQTSLAAEQQQFIANVAHQLKNPLAGIYIQMDLILDDSAHQFVAQRARLIKLRDAIHRVGRLTHQLLALARCSPDAIDNQAKEFINLGELIEDNASMWFDSALPKHIDLGFEIEPAMIHGIAWLVSEMLNNLVDNAIKYTPVHGKITVRCGYRDKYVFGYLDQRPFLEVEDSGPGVPPSEREKVFERFYRANDKRNTRDGSVGLGLAIVKKVAKYHNATIEINSSMAIESGTRFTIEFTHPDDNRQNVS